MNGRHWSSSATPSAYATDDDPGRDHRKEHWCEHPPLDNVGIVVEDIGRVAAFFVELGLDRLVEDVVEGSWVDRVVGLPGVRTKIAILQTRDGRGRLELMQFLSPEPRHGDGAAPPNTLGIRRLAFVVDDVDADVEALRLKGIELLGEVVDYEDAYRLCYVRGPEGIIVMLAQELDRPLFRGA